MIIVEETDEELTTVIAMKVIDIKIAPERTKGVQP